jgi:hypothetical protein
LGHVSSGDEALMSVLPLMLLCQCH